ncbi:MAG: hypothetical protein LBI28_09195 [Treponema sp.]|jgi:hypothetical protein|nr:hypothetical protein [Treponema sp.]
MKKITLLFLLLPVLFGCTPKNDTVQRATVDRICVLPVDDSPDFHDIEEAYVDFFKYSEFNLPTYSHIKIWGWSKDGKVAYSDYLSFEGEFLSVYILDFINDKILWKNTLDLYRDPRLDEASYDRFNGDYYLDFINNYRKVCVQNGIEFVQTELKKLPIRENNQTVNIILQKNESPLTALERDDLMIYGKYDSYTVIAENQGNRKTIQEKNFTAVYPDILFLCGYFMSPFENRALIVTGVFAHRWEGSDVTYTFAGCHLSNGFK